MMRLIGLIVIAAAIVFAGCGAEEPAGVEGPGAAAADADAPKTAYQVVLGNAITDTLRGSATFGRVLDQEADSMRFVIRLASSFDFAGGMIFTRKNVDLPEEGTYDLSADSLAEAGDDQFILLFREGMLRDLRSVSGSLSLSTVTDSLIVGEFDAILKGYIAERGRDLEDGEVHAVGRFRATQGMSGYIIGL